MECQNGFRKGRYCIDPLFNMKLLIEKTRKFTLETHLAFLDHVQSFVNVGVSLKYYKATVLPIYYCIRVAVVVV